MGALFFIVESLLYLFMWAVILMAVFSTLTSFGVLDSRNRIVWTINDSLYKLTQPALRPIRRILPDFGSIDVSPIILIVLIRGALYLLTDLRYQAVSAVGF